MDHLLFFSSQKIHMANFDSSLQNSRLTLECPSLILMPFGVGVYGNGTLPVVACRLYKDR